LNIKFILFKEYTQNLICGVRKKNSKFKHIFQISPKKWVKRKAAEKFTPLNKFSIAIWGLTYKPETSTLRRSLAVALCDWLIEEGANVHVYDPAVQELPSHWNNQVDRFYSGVIHVYICSLFN
jgi:UDP-glucose 6-dehydrogenase